MVEDIRKCILEILDENGIYIDSSEAKNDIDLREYLEDSIQYIYFVIELENRLGKEMPDEVLLYDKFSSLNGFVNMVADIKQNADDMASGRGNSWMDSNTIRNGQMTINMSQCQ